MQAYAHYAQQSAKPAAAPAATPAAAPAASQYGQYNQQAAHAQYGQQHQVLSLEHALETNSVVPDGLNDSDVVFSSFIMQCHVLFDIDLVEGCFLTIVSAT